MNLNKYFLSFFIIALFFSSIQSVSAASNKTHTLKSKDLTIKIEQADVSNLSGLRENEGIIDISVKYKKSNKKKDVRLNVICSDNNGFIFSDICNKDYLINDSRHRLHYILNDNQEHVFDFKFSIGDDKYKTIDYILKSKILVTSSNPVVKVISPNKGKTYSVGDKLKIKWQADNIPKNTGVLFQLQGEIKGIDNGFGIELPSMGFSFGSQDFSNMIDAKKGKGSFSWTIPNIYDFPGYDKNVYRVQAILRGENLTPNQNNNWKEVNGFSEEFYIKK